MRPELQHFISELKEIFKDSTHLGIYTGKEANELYRTYIDPLDEVFDPDYEDTTGYATGRFETPDGKPWQDEHEEYLDGAYYIEWDEETNQPRMWWDCYPEPPYMGKEAIIARLKDYQTEY